MVGVWVLGRILPFVVVVVVATCRRMAVVVVVMVREMIRILTPFPVLILDPGQT